MRKTDCHRRNMRAPVLRKYVAQVYLAVRLTDVFRYSVNGELNNRVLVSVQC